MRRLAIILVSLFFILLLSVAPGRAALKPNINLSHLVWDFGEVTAGDILKHSFIIENTGNGMLVIKSVTPSCSCLELELVNENVAAQGKN